MTVVTQTLDRMRGVAKSQRKFLSTLFATMLVTRTRLNFLNLSRHSSLNEKTYRRQFRQSFDFASFNLATICFVINIPLFVAGDYSMHQHQVFCAG